MSFNPDPTKMEQEVLFSREKSKVIHPSPIFNGKDVNRSVSQKHRGLVTSFMTSLTTKSSQIP